MKLRLLTSFMISASVLVLLLFCLKVLWAVTDLREPPDSRQLTVAKELKKTTKEQQPQDRVLKIKPCSYPGGCNSFALDRPLSWMHILDKEVH